METEELGFIGVGKIGLPIAKRLLDAGYRLRVFDVDKTALSRAVDLGMHVNLLPLQSQRWSTLFSYPCLRRTSLKKLSAVRTAWRTVEP